MTPDEVKKLVESAVATAVAAVTAPVAGLQQRALRGDAMVEANRILASVTLHESAKQLIVDSALRDIPLKDGALDVPKFTELVTAEAKRVGSVVAASTGAGRVFQMGQPATSDDPKEAKRLQEAEKEARKADKRQRKEAVSIFESLGMPEDAAKISARGRVA